jgi:hypothetical protein
LIVDSRGTHMASALATRTWKSKINHQKSNFSIVVTETTSGAVW